MNEKMKQLGTAFSDAVADDRFADFLKRIYKKKYRPPKARDTDGNYDTKVFHFLAVSIQIS